MKLAISCAAVLAALAMTAHALPSQLVLGEQQAQPDELHLDQPDQDQLEAETIVEATTQELSSYNALEQAYTNQPGSGWVWQSCGLDADVVRVDRVDVDPDPPQSGKNMTVKAAGEIKARVDVR